MEFSFYSCIGFSWAIFEMLNLHSVLGGNFTHMPLLVVFVFFLF